MMQLFRAKTGPSSRVGLLANPHYLALAQVEEREGRPWLKACRRVDLRSEQELERELTALVRELNLEGQQCSYVLNPSDYNLHLVEAPAVEADELQAAVRWKVKDLLDMKVDEAAVDVFRVPQDAYRGREMVYAVAAAKTRIRRIVELVTNTGLELAVVDIPELAMKNITDLYVDDSQGVAFMDLRRTGSTMNITHSGDLYLSRRINTQLAPDVMESPEWDSLKDRLVLEIQRSLDYYESQMGKGQIDKVLIAQRQQDTGLLTGVLDELLTAEVSAFNLAEYLRGDAALTPHLLQSASAAVGATLRGMHKAPDAETRPASGQEAA